MATARFTRSLHKNPNPALPVGKVVPFAGMPIGIELLARWLIQDHKWRSDADLPGTADVGDGDSWTVTVAGTTPVASLSDDLVPPRLIITNSAADDNRWEGQWTDAAGSGEEWALRAGKTLYFRTQFLLTDANNNLATVQQCDLFLGLCITDTTVIGGATDFIGFHKADGSGVVNFVAGKNAGASGALVDQIVQPTGVTLVAADAGTAEARLHTFEFVAVGTTTVYVFADGRHTATVHSTTQLPDDENLCHTIALQNGEAVAKIMHVAQFMTAMER